MYKFSITLEKKRVSSQFVNLSKIRPPWQVTLTTNELLTLFTQTSVTHSLSQHWLNTQRWLKSVVFFSKYVLFSKRPPARNPHWLIIKRAKLGGSPQQAGGDADQQAGGHADSCCCAGRPWGGLPQPPKTLKNPIFTIRATYQAHFNYQPLTSKQIPLQISHVNKSLTSSTNTTSSNIRFRIKTANSSIQS